MLFRCSRHKEVNVWTSVRRKYVKHEAQARGWSPHTLIGTRLAGSGAASCQCGSTVASLCLNSLNL